MARGKPVSSSDPEPIIGELSMVTDGDKAMHYVDTHFGELFDAKGTCGRYVRLYSRGNTANDLNHYIELEVYGLPVR